MPRPRSIKNARSRGNAGRTKLSLISVTARCNGLERWIGLAVGSAVPCLRAGRDAVTRTSIVGVRAERGNLGGCKRRYRRLALDYRCSSSMHGSSQQGHKDCGLEAMRHREDDGRPLEDQERGVRRHCSSVLRELGQTDWTTKRALTGEAKQDRWTVFL